MYSRHEEHSARINASAEPGLRSARRSDAPNGTHEQTLVENGVVYLDEVVIVREPPLTKTWETVGEPRLLVIGRYRMGFDLMPDHTTAQLRVAIDYELPTKGISRLLGRPALLRAESAVHPLMRPATG